MTTIRHDAGPDDQGGQGSKSTQAQQPGAVPASASATQQQTVQPKQAQPQQSQFKPAQGSNMNQSFTALSRRNVIGLRRGTSSETMRTLVETIDELSKDVSFDGVKFDFIEIEPGQNGLKIAGLVVAATSKNPSDKVVSHHTLILASTGTRTTAADGNFNGAKYERLLVPADGYDKRMRAAVEQRLAAKFPGYKQVSAEASVVPESINATNETEVLNLASNATIAASTILISALDQQDDFTLQGAAQANMAVEIKSMFAHATNLAGLPVRSDVTIEMLDVLSGSQQQQNNSDELSYSDSAASSLVSQINGYMDLIYHPTNAGGFGTQDNLYTYAPRLVITNIDSEVTNTLTSLLLALQTTQALAEQDRWQGALLRQYKEGAAHPMNGMNLRDLGVIGLEVPRTTNFNPLLGLEETKPARFQTASAVQGDALVGSLIKTYIRPKFLVVSMDVEENGPNTWLTSVFVAAARGNPEANQEIIDAADLLTLGNFSKRMKQYGLENTPFMINDNTYINLGVWNSDYGVRDIRDFDYLAVFNATGEADPQIIRDFSDQLVNSEIDPMFRLAKNREILTKLIAGMTVTGRAARVSVNPDALYCLSQSVRDAGLVFDVKFGSGAPIGSSRHTATFLNNIRGTNLGSSGAFMQGFTRRAGPGGMPSTGYGRWQQTGGNVGAGSY